MYQAEVISVVANGTSGVFKVTISYSKEDVFVKSCEYRLSEPSTIRQIALNEIQELERIDRVNALVADPSSVLGPITLSVSS